MLGCDNNEMSSEVSAVVGIDFGTTNSSVAYAGAGDVRLVQFPSSTGETASSRSLLYFQKQTGVAGSRVSSWTGSQAIYEYLRHDSTDEQVQGRLIQSLKSHLSDRTLTGTEIFRRKYLFGDLVTRMIRDLRVRASEALGFDVRHAVAGRPVTFVGARSEADNDYAEQRLRECFLQAGFESIRFVFEPVAAAYAYDSHAAQAETILIGDFGGGTTDFSVLKIEPTRRTPPQVLGSAGVGLAGDALDAKIVRKLISPALGSEAEIMSFGKRLPALPAWVFSNLERWHTLSFLRTHEVREMLRTAERRTTDSDKVAALRSVIDHDLGYQLHQAVQQLKVALSSEDEALFHLDAEAIQLQERVSRDSFNGWIEPERRQMEAILDELLHQTGLQSTDVQVVLTGGTSQVPAVRQMFTSRFGEERVHTADVFTSVAHGLARMAAEA